MKKVKTMMGVLILSIFAVTFFAGYISREEAKKKIVIKIKNPIQIDYKKDDPLKVLDLLAKAKCDWVDVGNAPKNWIRKEHIPALIKMLDSKKACAGVHSYRDSRAPGIGGYGPRVKGKSTIGHEAGFMIESFRHGLYPKSAAFSIDWTIDAVAIKAWWHKAKNENK